MTLQEQILKRIKTDKVRPTSRAYFRLRDYILWVLLGVFAAALSLGFGMIIFMIFGTDHTIFAKLGLSFSERLLYSIPIFWIVATIVVAVAAYINFRRTRKGYRVSARQFAVIAAVIAVAFGSMLYAFNVTRSVNRAAAENIPIYSAIVLDTETWFDPEHGLLSGSVKVKDSDDSFTLRDPNFDLWQVTGDDVSVVPAGFKFRSGDRIKIIGKKTGDLEFRAVEIRPFETEVRKEQATTSAIGR
ncbi:MAG TPA: hypothetical protein VHD69_00910 [Candidatus Paceibacterota bacterium]|nr:hypothetical protein [Candidatus Paceibacterota bacterium]